MVIGLGRLKALQCEAFGLDTNGIRKLEEVQLS